MVPLVVIEGAVKVLCVSSQLLGRASNPYSYSHSGTAHLDCITGLCMYIHVNIFNPRQFCRRRRCDCMWNYKKKKKLKIKN